MFLEGGYDIGRFLLFPDDWIQPGDFFWRFSHVVLLMFSDGRVFFRKEKFGNYMRPLE